MLFYHNKQRKFPLPVAVVYSVNRFSTI